MTSNTTFKRFVNTLFLMTLIVPLTGSVAFSQDYIAMMNYYKSRAEVVNANAGQQAAYGAILTAQAAHIRAQGEYLKNRADAFVAIQNGRKIQQEIHAMKLDNSLKYAETFYNKKKLYEAYRVAQRKRRPSPGETKLAKKSVAPARLTSHHLTYDGNISWPYALMNERFAVNREKLESIFVARSCGSRSQDYHEVKTTTDKMKKTLKSMIRDFSAVEYLAAAKMLAGLGTEARFAPRQRGDRIAVQRETQPNTAG